MNPKDTEVKDAAFLFAKELLETSKLPELPNDYHKSVFNTYVSVFLAGMTIENIKTEKDLVKPVVRLGKAINKLENADVVVAVNYLLTNLADEAPQYAANRLTILRGNVRQEIAQAITSVSGFDKDKAQLVESVCSGIVDSFVLKNEVDKRVNPRFKGMK